jgi:hypothetical protein
MEIEGTSGPSLNFSPQFLGSIPSSNNPFAALPAAAQPPFGLIIPGHLVRSDFVQVDNLKFSLSLNCPGDICVPLQAIRQIVFFVYPAAPVPPNHGVLCYWQISSAPAPTVPLAPPISTGFQLLGAVTPESPSAVFNTGWSENEDVINLLSNIGSSVVTITIGVSLEPLANIKNIGDVDSRIQQGKLFVAQKIASDLFKFMQSFDTGSAGANMMVVPNNIFDRWFQRFENRFRRDPNFFLKTEDEV